MSLQLDFENRVGKAFDVLCGELIEWPVDTNVHASPVVARTDTAIPVVFADEGEFGVEGDTDTGIARELEGGTVVEGSNSCDRIIRISCCPIGPDRVNY